MNGLEAIKFMEQGKMIQTECCIYKIKNGEVLFKRKLNTDNEFSKSKCFDFDYNYEEYIEPKLLTGWERVNYNDNVYVVGDECNIALWTEKFASANDNNYNNANYFSTKEKAEEINFKQTLFRKLQRFSDENCTVYKNEDKVFYIAYDYIQSKLKVYKHRYYQPLGCVYFSSEEVAEKAIKIFHDDLIKYFTYDWREEDGN